MKFNVWHQPEIPEKLKKAIDFAKWQNETLHNNTEYVMYCPHCGYPLVRTDRMEPLETIDEHISCTPVTKKTVFKCTNHDCDGQYIMWNEFGDAYMDISIENKEEFNDAYKRAFRSFGDWSVDAINSTAFKFNNQHEAPGLRKIKKFPIFKIFGFMPVINYEYEMDRFGKFLSFKYRLEYWIKGDTDGCYYIRPSLWRRLKYKYYKFRKLI